MDILENLRLGSWRISAQKHVDLSSKSASAWFGKCLADSSEQLAQNPFLDTQILVNTGSQGINENIIEHWVFWELLKLHYPFLSQLLGEFNVLILEGLVLFFFVEFVPEFVSFYEANYVNVGSKNILYGANIFVESHSQGSVNADHCDSVAWLYKIH